MVCHNKPLTALVLDQVRQATNRSITAVNEQFHMIAAAQPPATKRRKAADELVSEFVTDLHGRFPGLEQQISTAASSPDYPSAAHIQTLRVMLDLRPCDVPDHPGPAVTIPEMTKGSTKAWNMLLDLSEFQRRGWTLVGGQMVHLLGWEHGEQSPRPTPDADVVLDVRVYDTAVHDVTKKLIEAGFREDGVSPDGLGHRYVHGTADDDTMAKIDVLLPEGLPPPGKRGRADRFTTVTGARTIGAAGSVQALGRSMRRKVLMEGRIGSVIRPDVVAALVAKAAAYQVDTRTVRRERHQEDFVFLSTLFAHHYEPHELRERLTKKDRQRLSTMLGLTLPAHPVWKAFTDGLEARRLIVDSTK